MVTYDQFPLRTTCPALELLNQDLWESILTHLQLEDLSACAATCHTLHTYCTDSPLLVASLVGKRVTQFADYMGESFPTEDNTQITRSFVKWRSIERTISECPLESGELCRHIVQNCSLHRQFFSSTLMLHAVALGFDNYIRLLLVERTCDVSAFNNAAFRMAASEGHGNMVEMFLADTRVTPDTKRNQALSIAADNGHADIVSLLLRDGRVDPTAENNIALHAAITKGHAQVVHVLVNDPRVNILGVDRSVLQFAARRGLREVTDYFEPGDDLEFPTRRAMKIADCCLQ